MAFFVGRSVSLSKVETEAAAYFSVHTSLTHVFSCDDSYFCSEEHISRKISAMITEAKAKMGKGDKKGESLTAPKSCQAPVTNKEYSR